MKLSVTVYIINAVCDQNWGKTIEMEKNSHPLNNEITLSFGVMMFLPGFIQK